MHKQYDALQISKIIDQALVYQCACPAQVCRTIFELRDLHEYQMTCMIDPKSDDRVHTKIAIVTEKTHAMMEECLTEILQIEGWNITTLSMPESLWKKPIKLLQ
jgi:hypothetical protein